MSENKDDKESNRIKIIIIIAIVIVLLVVIILSVGIIRPELNDDESEKKKAIEEEQRIKRLQLEKQIKELEEEKNKLLVRKTKLEEKFVVIKKQEKIILIVARAIIGLLLIWFDYLFFKSTDTVYKPMEIIGDLLKLNSAILACYSFIAFITHGTPAKFVTYLKSLLRRVLRWYHGSTYTEFDGLLLNIELITKTIDALRKML